MTAAIVLQLVDEGLVALDDPLPPLDVLPNSPFPGQVTIRQLLDMTTSACAPSLASRATAASMSAGRPASAKRDSTRCCSIDRCAPRMAAS